MASGSGTGNTLVVTALRDAPCDGVLHVFACIYTESMANEGGFNLVDVVDNNGRHISPGPAGKAYIGGINQQLDFGGPNFKRLFITQSALRDYFATDYHAGDTFELTFNFPDAPNLETAAMVFATIGSTDAAVNQTFGGVGPALEYGLGDSYPDLSVNPKQLLWGTDYGDQPIPENDCMALVAAAAYPANGITTFAAAGVVGTVNTSDIAFGVGIQPVVGAGTSFEPGVIWNNDATMLVGNYQFAALAP